MLVKDIYGGDYFSQGLAGDVIASSFAKAVACNQGSVGKKHSYLDIFIHMM